ncbi:NUDIX hydrolase [Cellulomonas sp. URHE0023]|uniref:NUDIX domain-containing protein n=1 Tax=Cellulomonas sp. URHE0023 TaxID=1380354 RepID=UPI00054E937B|nr:NUDIX hydrolase [Cellulomonas sp. URHE0023]
MWHTRSSKTVYENPWIRVREDAVDRPDGGAGIYGVMEVRNPAVFVVPVTAEGEVVMVEVARYTTGTVSLEVPAGGSDGEAPLLAAQRELREETGLVADAWEPIGFMFALNGVSHAPEHVFLARDLRPSDVPAEQAEEGISAVRSVPWAEVLRLVADGTITDGETVAALMYAAIALGRVT